MGMGVGLASYVLVVSCHPYGSVCIEKGDTEIFSVDVGYFSEWGRGVLRCGALRFFCLCQALL